MKHDEGYIKFNLEWEKGTFDFPGQLFHSINLWRQKLYVMELIGAFADGVGFGNISIRYHNNQFIITGSATGNIQKLTQKHYALVKDFDLENNFIHCTGLSKASSESLSHAAIYKSNKRINAVVHIHDQKFWKKYIHQLPTTNENAAFGTPEIAREISKLTTQEKGIIIMGGHPEGIISYGKSLDDAGNVLLKYYQIL
ncbi:MAG: class II aldolase/adducin family protein [Bacteroidota bacterium]|nr:class II aldolase/adducin family protein [Bacteroidota bacterium]